MWLEQRAKPLAIWAKRIFYWNKKYDLNKDRVVVEINLEILENEQYETYILKEHDAIEIISFIGGGWFENIC